MDSDSNFKPNVKGQPADTEGGCSNEQNNSELKDDSTAKRIRLGLLRLVRRFRSRWVAWRNSRSLAKMMKLKQKGKLDLKNMSVSDLD